MQFNGNLAIIGTGRMAKAMALLFEQVGIKVKCIVGRDLQKAQLITELLYDTEAINSLDLSDFEIDIALLAVADDAIEGLSEQLKLPNEAIIAHTSGSMGLEVLQKHGDNRGVFYPLQSVSATNQINFREVPICIEAATLKVHETLTQLAKMVSDRVVSIDSEKRLTLHVAAVMASNFTNHLLFQAENILSSSDLDLSILKPLMRYTLEKAFDLGPEAAQTGPAVRRDFITLQKHYEYLADNPELLKLYKYLSNSILRNS